ncbi:UDP-2,3-diacylglucosamine diphosphatase LpxI domain-containing protein [Pelagibacterium mangrovi]|uniref:UDP-2,3-diacylglucosamine diphosphatase LpxI domain-containing protein n=1 Tax=Pelagibacterium mangrovi TaxID=3119828 RepID=UPI002FC787FE
MSGPGRLALVVGSGDLVPQAIAAARAAGWEIRVLALHPRADLASEDPFSIKVSRPDQVLREIRKFKATHVCAVGAMHMSDKERETFAEFAGEKEATGKGDSKLSQLGSALLKMLGLPFIGVHEIVADLLAPEGQIGAVPLEGDLRRTAEFAFNIARKGGTLDLGQALVVAGGRVVATEDIGGTDELLERCRVYRERGLIGNGRGHLVLAKTSKPGQPLHIDLPAIGKRTIELAEQAGIEAIVVETGRTLLIGRAELVAAADAASIAILGLMASDD